MSEFEGSAPSAGDASTESSTSDAASTVSTGESAVSTESAEAGFAPSPTDSAPALEGQETSPQAPGGFVFGGRQFRDQKHAEEYFRSQVGRVPETQRKLAMQEKSLAEMQARMEALQNALVTYQQAGGIGQGGPGQQAQPATPQGFADELVKSGDLQFISELAEEKGLAHAIYALADRFDQRIQHTLADRTEQMIAERLMPIERRAEFTDRMNQNLSSIRQLAQAYPELDENNKSPEAQEAQQEILEIWKSLPQDLQFGNPQRAWRLAVMEYRETHGIPSFAANPGTSGSPSARAALAAEASLGAPTPLDGSQGARQKPATGPNPLSPEEAFEQEIMGADSAYAKSQDGNVLWRRVS